MAATFENNWIRWAILQWKIEELSDEVSAKINQCENAELLRELGKHNYHLAWAESNWSYIKPSEFNDPNSDSASLDGMIDYLGEIEAETRELLNMN